MKFVIQLSVWVAHLKLKKYLKPLWFSECYWCHNVRRHVRLTLKKETCTCRPMSIASECSAPLNMKDSSSWLHRTSSSQSPWMNREVSTGDSWICHCRCSHLRLSLLHLTTRVIQSEVVVNTSWSHYMNVSTFIHSIFLTSWTSNQMWWGHFWTRLFRWLMTF